MIARLRALLSRQRPEDMLRGDLCERLHKIGVPQPEPRQSWRVRTVKQWARLAPGRKRA